MDASTFKTNIIQSFHLESVPAEEQSTYVDQLGELVLQGVLIKSLSALDAQHASELEQMVDMGREPFDILDRLQSLIPGFDDLVRDEITAIQKDIETTTGQA